MSRLRLKTLSMPSAALGPPNPLPPLFHHPVLHEIDDVGDADAEMRRQIGYGGAASVLPYLLQDGYGRERVRAGHRAAVLENDVLRATFLLETGGRLWSLVHKPTDRELLHRNPVFQPANLALRNAWVAGGVEWNIGTTGHSPLTCEPVHAVRVQLPDGSPALRMYELERMRELVFQVDAWLPDHSPVLLVRVRVVNPNEHAVPVYWWTNAAVPQADDVRVLAPARSAWTLAYDGRLRRVDVPTSDGVDQTYPTRSPGAADHFFDIADGNRRWIAALDGSGRGLVHTSTDLLRGRKLFRWGHGRGGNHWQEWLSGPDAAYLEIQAGLARTQLEHLPLPARESWSWVEAFGLLEADADAAHGDDWGRAVSAAATALEGLLPRDRLDAVLEASRAWEDAEPAEALQTGSGWGALERRLRLQEGDDSLVLAGTPFGDESLGDEQRPWLELLTTGAMAEATNTAPCSYQTSDRWTPLLRSAPGWLPLLHLGVVRLAHGDTAGARKAWLRSLDVEPTAWAHRNLAALAAHDGDRGTARDHFAPAVALVPDLLPLVLEYVDVLLDDGDAHRALDALHGLPPRLRESGRARLAEARAALLAGDLDRCGAVLDAGLEVADLREGEGLLHELWIDLQAARLAAERGCPVDEKVRAEVLATVGVPRGLDFRMRP